MSTSSEPAESRRITVSLSDLRSELGQLELRLVDRLNAALSSKADRSVQDQLTVQMADVLNRMTALEGSVVKRDGPVVQAVQNNTQDIANLKNVAGYRKWLWAQTVALIGIAIPVLFFGIEKASS